MSILLKRRTVVTKIYFKENARLIAVDAKTSVITYDLDEQKQEKKRKKIIVKNTKTLRKIA